MKLAFCLFNYFPYGGLQRDFLRIARACQLRGHEIHVYTMRWEGEPEPDFHVQVIETKGWQNHTRARQFAAAVKTHIETQAFDLVIGFNKMPHLDIYYAADVCYQARVREQRSFLNRLLPRYRQQLAFEKAVFAKHKQTDILLISALQQGAFEHHYQTEAQRFHLLPPGIAKDRIAPPNATALREAMRETGAIPEDHFLLLMVGSGFKTKGVDRSLQALASLPPALKARCHLWVVGEDHAAPFQKLAVQWQIADKVQFLGGRADVPQLLLAADLLLHPAYHENTGTVLLEAMIAGLPVLTTDVCGYAHYVQEANAGQVLPSPFQQAALNAALQTMLLSTEHAQWQENGKTFANEADIYSLPEKAADFIDHAGRERDAISK